MNANLWRHAEEEMQETAETDAISRSLCGMAMARAHQSSQALELDIDVEMGIVVQSLMFRHRQRQQDLAEVLGVNVATVSRKLRGIVAFSIKDLYAIGRAYDVDPADLLNALPRLDSNQQPFGYQHAQVRRLSEPTAADLERWAALFDRCASGESRAGCAGGPDLTWRDWINTGHGFWSALSQDELHALYFRWDRYDVEAGVSA
jgi:transcriptional regulator with XRE-family HTH domain